MKLYGANVCPFVHRVRLVLSEKALDHEYVAIDLANKPEWYHDVLPTGKVPLLEDGGYRLWESDVVCEYLDEAYPEVSLMPAESGERAKARLQCAWAGSRFVPVFYKLLAGQDPDFQEKRKEEFGVIFKELEERLSHTDSPFFLNELSLADTALFPWFERWCVLEHYRNFEMPAPGPRTSAWLKAMGSRDSVVNLRMPEEFFIQQYQGYADGSIIPK